MTLEGQNRVGGGGEGTIFFSLYVGSGTACTIHGHPQKIWVYPVCLGLYSKVPVFEIYICI